MREELAALVVVRQHTLELCKEGLRAELRVELGDGIGQPLGLLVRLGGRAGHENLYTLAEVGREHRLQLALLLFLDRVLDNLASLELLIDLGPQVDRLHAVHNLLLDLGIVGLGPDRLVELSFRHLVPLQLLHPL